VWCGGRRDKVHLEKLLAAPQAVFASAAKVAFAIQRDALVRDPPGIKPGEACPI
jgi:hypothetical protein